MNIKNIVSPLVSKGGVTRLESFRAIDLIEAWEAIWAIDVSNDLEGIENLFLYECNLSGLRFFVPTHSCGLSDFYGNLSKIDWYYMPQKWEHDVAVRDLCDCRKIIELGCGKGAFLEKLINKYEKEAIGVELNQEAVDFCRDNGIPAISKNISEIAHQRAEEFDAVCTFQVLEHIPDPLSFLSNALKTLRPAGKLIISVPNQESFIQYAKQDLFNMPPHHVTQWRLSTFQYLEKILPVKLQCYEYEPLADYHALWYLSVQCDRFPKYTVAGMFFRLVKRYMSSIFRHSGFLRRFIVGHTLYVVFRKNEDSSRQPK